MFAEGAALAEPGQDRADVDAGAGHLGARLHVALGEGDEELFALEGGQEVEIGFEGGGLAFALGRGGTGHLAKGP